VSTVPTSIPLPGRIKWSRNTAAPTVEQLASAALGTAYRVPPHKVKDRPPPYGVQHQVYFKVGPDHWLTVYGFTEREWRQAWRAVAKRRPLASSGDYLAAAVVATELRSAPKRYRGDRFGARKAR
jgi:hypothetical protein